MKPTPTPLRKITTILTPISRQTEEITRVACIQPILPNYSRSIGLSGYYCQADRRICLALRRTHGLHSEPRSASELARPSKASLKSLLKPQSWSGSLISSEIHELMGVHVKKHLWRHLS